LEEGIKADAFPASVEALRVASLLPRGHATRLFTAAQGCKKKSISKMVKRLEPVVRARTRKYEKLIEIFYPWPKVAYLVSGTTKTVEFTKANEEVFNEVASTILNGAKENRGAFKAVELVLYAKAVADLPFPEVEEPAGSDSAG
jgi:hypothetical protein